MANNPVSAEFLHFPALLSAAQLSEIDQLLEQAAYINGQATATLGAREVKNNLQVDMNRPELIQPLQYILLQGFNSTPLFHAATLPKQIYAPLFSQYQPGMYYGWHVDSPLMGQPPVRSDIAMTIFLEHPDAYDGGELEIQGHHGPILFKLPKGDAICYPCNYLHQVREVTKGTRKVAVTWIQSMIKSPDQRNILFSIKQLHDRLFSKDPKSTEANELLQTYSNLVRMWAEL